MFVFKCYYVVRVFALLLQGFFFIPDSVAMCRCSPVLKSLTASLMNHYESCREKQASNSPKQMEACCKLVRCLSKVGGFINVNITMMCMQTLEKLSAFN